MSALDAPASTPGAVTTDALHEALHEALGRVRDPELDRPITDLGFVRTVEEHDGAVDVWLALPTYFCAPNFAYLMVADAYDALTAVPGVRRAGIHLVDHFAAEEINEAIAAQAGFAEVFPGQTTADLAELRRTFQRKAHRACLERATRRLIGDGWPADRLAAASLADLPDSPERDSLVRRRRELGLPTGPDTPLLLDDDGHPVPPEQAPRYLRLAKTTRVSIDANTTWCLGLLATRYGGDGPAGPQATGGSPSGAPRGRLDREPDRQEQP